MKKRKPIDVTPGEYVWTLSMILVMGTLLGWGLFGSDGWIEALAGSKTASEWTQGIGSLVGIAIAIYVPWKQRRDELNDRTRQEQRRARALASKLRAPLEDWMDRTLSLDGEVMFANNQETIRQILWSGTADHGIFDVPKGIELQLDELYLLKSGGDLVFDALRKAHEAGKACHALVSHVGLDGDFSTNDVSTRYILRRYMSMKNDIMEALQIVVKTLE